MTVTATPELRLHHLLRDARLACGLTQTELATKAGMTQPKISRGERGDYVPDVFEMQRLAQACDAGWLLDLRTLPSACMIAQAGQDDLSRVA